MQAHASSEQQLPGGCHDIFSRRVFNHLGCRRPLVAGWVAQGRCACRVTILTVAAQCFAVAQAGSSVGCMQNEGVWVVREHDGERDGQADEESLSIIEQPFGTGKLQRRRSQHDIAEQFLHCLRENDQIPQHGLLHHRKARL